MPATDYPTQSQHTAPAAPPTFAGAASPAPDAEDTPLPPNTPALVEELAKRLAAGEHFDNLRLAKLAAEVTGGTRAEGAFTPRDAYDAVEAAVNLLLLRHGGAAMLEVPNPRVPLKLSLLPLVARLPRQTDRTEEQLAYQQFSTPPHLAYVAARVAAIRPDDVCIESSAGTGSLAVWPLSLGCRVHTNELSPRRRALLRLLGFEPTGYDAQFIHDLLPDSVRPTLALHNPPFSSSAGMVEHNRMEFGLRHVESVLARLEERGRYVGYLGRGLSFEHPRFDGWWRDVAARYNVRANLSIPEGEYARYGTTFGVQLVVIDKDGPTPGSDWEEQQANIVHGKPATLEEALDLLAHVAASRPDPFAPPPQPVKAATHGAAPPAPPAPEDAPTPDPPADANSGGEPAAAVAPEAAQPEAASPEAAAAEEEAEEEAGTVYVPYVPRKLKGGRPHPAPLVEAATMACVDPPDITYRPRLQPFVITEGRLSDVQLERVIYAGQRHSQRLAGGARPAFLIGDGAGVGKGRPQPLDAQILTPTGWKLMGEIRVGDLVITVDGTAARVVGVYPQGEMETFSVSFSDGTATECSGDHLWTTQTRRQRYYEKKGWGINYATPKVRTTRALARDLHKLHSIPQVNPVEFQERKIDLDPYLLGVLLADGTLRKDAAQITSADEEILEHVRAALPCGLKLRKDREYHYGITKGTHRWQGLPRRHNTVVNALRQYGLAGKVAATKFVPDDYKFNSTEVRLALLQGLMDCDGYVSADGNVVYYTVSSRLADDIAFLVQSLGGVATRGLKQTERQPCHVIYIKLPQAVAPFRLSRKAARVKPAWVKYPPRRIIRGIEPAGRRQTQCIAVYHPSRLYVTNDFIVTHNTIAGIILDNWNQGRRRSVWFSASADLIVDSRLYIADLGVPIPVVALSDYTAAQEIDLEEGVIFCTYSTLISSAKSGETRLDQLRRWLGREPVVVLDECLPAGTMIATPEGSRPIEELKAGDAVLGFNHATGRVEPTQVLNTFWRETREPLHRINDTFMTGNHPVWTHERDYVRADQVTGFDAVALLAGGLMHGGERLHLRMVPPVLHAQLPAEQEAQGGEAPVLQPLLLGEVEDVPAGVREEADDPEKSPGLAREPQEDQGAPRSSAEDQRTLTLHVEPLLLAQTRAKTHKTLKEQNYSHLNGGNGTGLTEPQAFLRQRLGWPAEYAIGVNPWKPGYPRNYKVDLAEPELRLAIEIDGKSHATKIVKEADKRKEAYLLSIGWRVIRFRNEEVLANPDQTVATILKAARSITSRPGPATTSPTGS